MPVLPNELSLDYHLCSTKAAEFPSQEHGKRQLISRQLPTPTCCHTLQHSLVETQEDKKKTTKPCRGLGRLICLASVSVLGRQQRLCRSSRGCAKGTGAVQRQEGAGRCSCPPEGTGTLQAGLDPSPRLELPSWSSPHPAFLPHCSILKNPSALSCPRTLLHLECPCSEPGKGRAELRQPRQQELSSTAGVSFHSSPASDHKQSQPKAS